MTTVFSYTQMARSLRPSYLAGDLPTQSQDQLERWFMDLDPVVRAEAQIRLRRLVSDLPPLVKQELAAYLRTTGHQSPVPLGLDGLGCCMWPLFGLGAIEGGVGQWGALITGLAQIGSGLFQSEQMKDLQKDLARSSLASNERIEAAKIAAAEQTQRIMADAQIKAAQLAAESSVAATTVRVTSPVAKVLAWTGGGAAVLLAAGFAVYLFRKPKK